MITLQLSPKGTLEYDENGITSTAPFNKVTSTYDEITEIKFIKPTIITNGLIIFKFKNQRTINCAFKRKRLEEAKRVYDQILRLKNEFESQKLSEVTDNIVYSSEYGMSNLVTNEELKDNATSESSEVQIKYCSECGTKVIPKAKFCMNCGTKLTIPNHKDNCTEEMIVKENITFNNNELKELVDREEEQFTKMANEEYYFSEESKIKGKQVYEDKKQYLIHHPDDFDRKGASIFGILWSAIDDIPKDERKIFTLTGKGKYIEEQGDYEEAIKVYQEADALTLKVCAKDIQELTKQYGEKDWLYCAKIRQRIRVCENNILRDKTKKLEEKAKKLEKTNPSGAIEIYNQLNELKPGLKKYNKRIEICEKRI